MVRAVEKVRDRMLRAARVLESASIPYAIVGGNAVAAWVTTVDEAAVRNTRGVDVLIRRDDFGRVKTAMAAEGFVYRHVAGVDLFLDGEDGSARDAVHIVLANEKVRDHEPLANPDVTESHDTGDFRIVSLEALVQIKLTANREIDRVPIRDMLEVGLIDGSWVGKLLPELGERLQALINDPNG